jgi:hypothetical protein
MVGRLIASGIYQTEGAVIVEVVVGVFLLAWVVLVLLGTGVEGW